MDTRDAIGQGGTALPAPPTISARIPPSGIRELPATYQYLQVTAVREP
jgi:hypothetical protein